MATETTLNRYSSSHSVYNLNYHIVFCSKYRRKVLQGLEEELKTIFQDVAEELGIKIKTMEIMPDHVHIFVSALPSLTPQFIVNQLKGCSSHILREKYEWLRKRIPTLWTRSYYIGSVGSISESTVMKYIENQKNV